jgi:hypothetical protein
MNVPRDVGSTTKTSLWDAQSIAQARAKQELPSNPRISQPRYNDSLSIFESIDGGEASEVGASSTKGTLPCAGPCGVLLWSSLK